MICPNEDKLMEFAEGFLDEDESKKIEQHLCFCPNCTQQIEVMKNEMDFLKETLKSPVLPDHFAETIVAQVTPYRSKKKNGWKWGMGAVASVLITGWILLTVNPSFADLVGGIFSSDRVDEGLQTAMNTDIATPVDLSVTDAGITLHVEDLIADTTRIALSYQVTDSKGKKLNPYIEEDAGYNTVKLFNENNKQMEHVHWSWQNSNNYGIFEFSLVNVEQFNKGTIQITATKIAGKNGNWVVEIPVDLTAAYANQQIVKIGEMIEIEDIEVTLNQVNYATSTTNISYSTEYNDKAKQQLKTAIEMKEQLFNEDFVNIFFPYHPTIGYRIENELGDVLGYYNIYGREDRGHPVDLHMIGGAGTWDGQADQMGRMSWNDSFVPRQEEDDLYFVLDTVFKSKTTDFSVTFKPEELPYTFQYNGYELTIDAIEQKTDYSLEKSWFPINRQVITELHISGYAKQRAPELVLWAIEVEGGESYFTYNSGSSTLDETDEQGRFKREIQLISYGLKELPEEITLHLIAETEAIKLENEWRVPLFHK